MDSCVEISHQTLGNRQEIFTLSGGADAASCAFDQFQANKLFELFNRQSDSGLSAGQLFCGTIKATFFGDHDKGAQVSKSYI